MERPSIETDTCETTTVMGSRLMQLESLALTLALTSPSTTKGSYQHDRNDITETDRT